ncbi:rubrerythrin family protein [Fuchsiella alkaliacetigena]|uniref:rubrerythrin family protein n=1 Tax=Fuchsiella alkaliacetigena TaxID=957042 RepID=UPI00200A3348|nr:rubrerythrin family protein [Fuchsiella alkaliacetigena]MCK8825733.1 rubrerythrin family protein [Fuchsiella alkaliacetigena]
MKDYKREIYSVLRQEVLARCRYELFAEIARQEGLHYYAKIFEETAQNELSHAREIFRILGKLGSTEENLRTAIEAEKEEQESVYPRLAEQAMAEGELEAARLFKQIGMIEERHQQRLERLLELLESDSVFKREEAIKWKCRVCGYVYEGTEPPQKCPGCQNDITHYEPEDFGI